MKYVYALISGIAFGWVMTFVIGLAAGFNLNMFGVYQGGVAAGLFLTSTLLFIDKIKSK